MIYRTLLRACGNGRRPEVLPFNEKASSSLLPSQLPRSSQDVVSALRHTIDVDPFTALRHSMEHARALWPEPASLPDTLPAFVLSFV